MIHGFNRNVHIPCHKTLGKRLNTRLQKMHDIVKSALSKASFVCTTADIWTVNRKSYLGMTAHYIDINSDFSVSRNSVGLSCQRFLGSHTYDAVAGKMFNIHNSYNLGVEKIIATITDNASNFSKAFKEYFNDTTLSHATEVHEEHNDDPEAENDDESYETESNDDVDVVNMNGVLMPSLDDADAAETDIVLPYHETCISHSFNLLATTDATKALDTDGVFKRLYRAALAKCTSVWNLTHRSSKASDEVKRITSKAILSPVPTRWNSQYDSIRRILELSEKLGDICDALKLPKFKKQEIECLEEYVTVMGPIAVAIDKLQGDNVFFGHVFPTLHTVQQKLTGLQQRPMKHAKNFAVAMLSGLTTRFDNHLSFTANNSNRIIAAISHPYFKLRWIPDDKKEFCRNLFLSAARTELEQLLASSHPSVQVPPTNHQSTRDDDFFSFSDFVAESEVEVDRECYSYLSDCGTELKILSKYDTIKYMFIKFNTALASSVPVERMFSMAGQIQTPRRNLLSDIMFENLLLLKING